jgi:uncharacterized membrane protein
VDRALGWFPPAAAAFALIWVAALLAAPLLPLPLAGALYAAGSLICHQLPERSFHVQSFQLPVCARCFGLYVGGAIGTLAVALVPRLAGRPSSARTRMLMTALAAVPTAGTVVLEHGLGAPLSNAIRALAAVPLAATVAVVVVGAVTTLHYGECAPRRPSDHGPPPRPTNI